MTNGLAQVLDLSKPFDLKIRYDCVISFEVGEHIPPQKEKIFIENLVKHSKKYIAISWAIPGQGGTGHFNEKSNQYIIKKFSEYDFKCNLNIQNKFRIQLRIYLGLKTLF